MLVEDFKGVTANPEDHPLLFHITDHHGYAYTIAQNTLKSGALSSQVCTTYNQNMNSVGGRMHYDFKFVLKAKPLLEMYGGRYYTDTYREVGVSRSRIKKYKEDEIRLNTDKIESFDEYLVGTILLFPLFSEKGIQWLLYRNSEYSNFLGGAKSEAPRAIEMMYKQIYEWKKPIWNKELGNVLTVQEMQFIKDAYRIHKRGGDFKRALINLSKTYPIIGHWGKPLDSITVKRQFLAPKLVKMLNGYYVGRKRCDISLDKVRKLLQAIFNTIGIGNNAIAVLMDRIEKSGLMHVMTAPVVWSSIIKDAMEGDIDAAIKDIDFLGKQDQSLRAWYDNDPVSFLGTGEHYGTSFGRLGPS